MKHIRLISLIVGCILISSMGEAQYGPTSYDYQYQLKTNRDRHKIVYGYYPYYFSNAARSRYSYSAEEKGSYIYGRKTTAWPFSKRQVGLEQIDIPVTSGIWMSDVSKHDRDALDAKVQAQTLTARNKVVKPRINATPDIERIIKQNKWTFESNKMRDAILFNLDAVDADPINYEKKFRQ